MMMNIQMRSSILLLAMLLTSQNTVAAFTTKLPNTSTFFPSASSTGYLFSTARHAKSPSRRTKPWTDRERDAIINRNGEYFKLDRMRGDIQFGSCSRISTSLQGADASSIQRWLSNDKAVAMSIWDEKLIQEVEPQVYRLKLMTLMFVTIQLAPHVDVRMWTDKRSGSSDSGIAFKLESVGFDPNIQILPGVGVSADSLGILIDVVGELYPSKDGKGVDGKIGFVTSGELPPPMRILPEQALKGSLSTINRTITNFAISSFQKGTRTQFQHFLQAERSKNGPQ